MVNSLQVKPLLIGQGSKGKKLPTEFLTLDCRQECLLIRMFGKLTVKLVDLEHLSIYIYIIM